MLPLWIIDLTQKTDRRDEFQRLVGKIKHVYMPKAIRTSSTSSDGPSMCDDGCIVHDMPVNGIHANTDPESDTGSIDKTLKEVFEVEEREKAAKNAVIKGNYWYYSLFEMSDYFKQRANTDSDHLQGLAGDLYEFQEALVKAAKSFVRELRRSNVKPYQAFNVVVLGDSTQELSRMIFSSVAIMLQKEKGRFLTGHIHQGMNIMGMLYMPCDINSYVVGERVKVLRLLKEIDVQHNVPSIRGYDRMMLYQDVQNRTECTYPQLDSIGQAQYLLQCLVHLYLACDINHPMIQGTGSDDTFYFSMGASSVYFDMSVEDDIDADKVVGELLNNFKEDGDHTDPQFDIPFMSKELYEATSIVSKFNVDSVDLDSDQGKNVSPHPIINYLDRNLKRRYYGYHLKFFPAEMLRDILRRIDEATSHQLDTISSDLKSQYKSAEITILPAITRILSKVNEHSGALSFLENKVKDMQEFISQQKENIQHTIEHNFWDTLMYEKKLVPKNYLDHFEDYHDAYVNDVKTKNGGSGCFTMRDEVITNLKRHLSTEKTTLSVLSRSFLLGIICVLSLLPALTLISPDYVNLGDIEEKAFYWGTFLFLIPILCQLVSFCLYIRKRNAYIRVLKAYYTHDAYARIANRLEFEINDYYNRLIALFEEYLTRCKRIRKEVNIITPNPELQTLFPTSIFNQPLNGGEFGGDNLIPQSEIERSRIRINYQPLNVNSLQKNHYYILINKFNDILSLLFQDVYVIENNARRFNEDLGDYEFISRKELEDSKELTWKRHIVEFKQLLNKSLKTEMLPREYPTVGDKLIQYKKKIDKYNLLESMIAYAATNGEFCSDANTEFADVKVNRDIEDLVTAYLPLYTTRMQVAKYDEIYQKYIFVTRWRRLNSIALNRILPKEDFDMSMRAERVFADELKAKERKKKKEDRMRGSLAVEDDISKPSESQTEYTRVISSLILWAVCPDDNSSEWFHLFDVNHFSTAFKDRCIIREVLNQND